MAKKKRVYEYGKCYKCPKCFVTYEIELSYDIESKENQKVFGRAQVLVRNVVTREEITVAAETLDSYEPEYTYCE
jgi:hypothetical protein